jgi:hypothetical protein
MAQVSQDPIDNILVLNAGNDFYGPAATAADLDV